MELLDAFSGTWVHKGQPAREGGSRCAEQRSPPLRLAETRILLLTYLILLRGPLRAGKVWVLSAWMPAWWSPSNGVAGPGQPAFLAWLGSENHTPRWKVCTGANFGPFLASG